MEEHPDQAAAVEFTHPWYRGFLERLDSAYEFGTFAEGTEAGRVLLRHDVDLSLAAAVGMARIEADLGVRSTYCVLLTSPLYNPLDQRDRIEEIESLGHEVALHFSTHEHWPAESPPSPDALERRVEEELTILDAVVDGTVETVSFHVPPEWVLDRTFEGFRNAYAPEFFGDIGYVADSGQRWREDPPRVESLPSTVQVLAHPGLWGTADAAFEERVARAVDGACRRADRVATAEFVEEVYGR